MFFNPMWDNEAERIGFQRCTGLGYSVRLVSDYCGMLGFVLLIALLVGLCSAVVRHNFLWLLLVPAALVVLRIALFITSSKLAERRGFHYDYERAEATWIEDGVERSYRNLPRLPYNR